MGIFSFFKDKIAQYVDVRIRLFKLNFIGRTASLLSFLMFGMIVIFIFFCIILFVGFGLTEFFILLGLTKLASFLITIGVYILLLAIVIACRKQITKFFASSIINVMTEGDERKKEEEDD